MRLERTSHLNKWGPSQPKGLMKAFATHKDNAEWWREPRACYIDDVLISTPIRLYVCGKKLFQNSKIEIQVIFGKDKNLIHTRWMINGEATHCCEVRASVAIWYTKAFSLFHALSSTKVSFVFYGTRKSKRKRNQKYIQRNFGSCTIIRWKVCFNYQRSI